jgi:hypothetical protein
LVRVAICHLLDSGSRQGVSHSRVPLGRIQPAAFHHELEMLTDRHMRPQREILENESELSLVRWNQNLPRRRDLSAIEP